MDCSCLLYAGHEAGLAAVDALEWFTNWLSRGLVLHRCADGLCDVVERDAGIVSREASRLFKLTMVAPGVQGLDFVAEEGKEWTKRWNASDHDGHIFFDAEKVVSC